MGKRLSIKNRLKLTLKGLRRLFFLTSEATTETRYSRRGTSPRRENSKQRQSEQTQFREERSLGAVEWGEWTYHVIQLERQDGEKLGAFDVVSRSTVEKHPLKQRFIFDTRTAWKIALMLLKIAVDNGQPKGSGK